jgi:hypothetical protein
MPGQHAHFVRRASTARRRELRGGALLAHIFVIPTASPHLPQLVADHRGISCVQPAYPFVAAISQVAAIVVSVSAQGDVCHRQPKRPGFGAGGHQPQLKQNIVW